jgi:hypothetical protein
MAIPVKTRFLRRRMNLEAVYPEGIRPVAAEALGRGDWRKFLNIASDKEAMSLWYDNRDIMKEMGVYEESLLHAWSRQRMAGGWSLNMLASLLLGNRDKFATLAPLPASAIEPDAKVTVYRGVGKASRETIATLRQSIPEWKPPQKFGLSWTLDIETARRFAVRWFGQGVVCKARVGPDAIWAYIDSRQEKECLIPLPNKMKVNIVEKVKNQSDNGYVPKISSQKRM